MVVVVVVEVRERQRQTESWRESRDEVSSIAIRGANS